MFSDLIEPVKLSNYLFIKDFPLWNIYRLNVDIFMVNKRMFIVTIFSFCAEGHRKQKNKKVSFFFFFSLLLFLN